MFIKNYFIWHYLTAPKKIIEIWGNYLRFFFFYFIPAPQLLKVLFAPWKRDISSYGRGFDFGRFFETLIANTFSRLLGAISRLILIFIALLLELLTLGVGLAFFVFWLAWPLILIAPLTLFPLIQVDKIFILIGLFVDIALIVIFGLVYKKSVREPLDQMELKKILRQPWAYLIWERLGFRQKDIPAQVIQEPEKFLEDFLKNNDLKNEDFSYVVQWQIAEQIYKENRKKFWQPENLFAKGGLGRSWLYGWTATLDKFSKELGETKEIVHLIGRRQEVEAISRILCKDQQSNVLLVGEPGVGKKTLIRQFARLVKQGRTATPIAWRRVLELDLNAALSGLITEGQIKDRLFRIFNEAARAGNIILVIDEFHNFVFGDKDILPILMPFIERSYFQLIAGTTYEGLINYIEKNAGLLKLFEKVEVKEPDLPHTLFILQDNLSQFEKRTGRRVTYQALKEIVKIANQYIADIPMPEKALDLLEESVLHVAAATSDYFVLPEHVDFIVSQKTGIPVGELASEEKEKLINLEDFLHRRVINQELAIQQIASAMRRARSGVSATNRPMGSFLFLGPTGVGKTETAKALAEAYFNSESRMLRFDMSEYQGPEAIDRMIGSTLTQQQGLLTTAVHKNPFSLLLLDEIEKADKKVLDLFLQVLDEGWLTDAFGRKINFRNLIIIATSNASAELVRQMVQQGFDPNLFKQQVLDYIQQNNIFKPEFLNRFDGIVVFHPLSPENVQKIARLLLNNLANRLKEQDIFFNISDALVEKVAQLGFDQENGARAMRRAIQDKVENLIAKKLLTNEIQKNTPFEIRPEEVV